MKKILLIVCLLTAIAMSENNTCSKFHNCHECVKDRGCVWCGDEGFCTEGHLTGAYSAEVTCTNWRYTQCLLSTFDFFLLGALGILLTVVIVLVVVLACKTCVRDPVKARKSIETTEEAEPLMADSVYRRIDSPGLEKEIAQAKQVAADIAPINQD